MFRLSLLADVGGEAFEGGVGAFEPAEDESVGEGRPGPEAFASDEAGLGGDLIGVGGEQGLEGVGQLRYTQHGDPLRSEQVVINSFYRRGSP